MIQTKMLAQLCAQAEARGCDAKKSARKAVIGWVMRGCLVLLLLGLAVKLGLAELVLK